MNRIAFLLPAVLIHLSFGFAQAAPSASAFKPDVTVMACWNPYTKRYEQCMAAQKVAVTSPAKLSPVVTPMACWNPYTKRYEQCVAAQ